MFWLISAVITVILLVAALSIWRLIATLNPNRPKPIRNGRASPHEPTHLLIVLGSGGHTAEMIAMLERAISTEDSRSRLNWTAFAHRTWVTSSGDTISPQRAKAFEDKARTTLIQKTLEREGSKSSGESGSGTYDIQVVPRAREIHQPLLTAPFSSLRCALACYGVLTRRIGARRQMHFPDLILCNGPATAAIVIFTSVALRFFDIGGCASRGKMRVVYVESWARVKKLSLSGKLLSRVVDRFLVQWPQLEKLGGRVEYMGVLV